MKKVFLSVAIVATAGFANAQGFYAGVNLGYGISNSSDLVGTEEVKLPTGDTTSKNIYGTLGRGFNTGLNFGYMITDHIGVDLGLNYLMGSKLVTESYDSNTEFFVSIYEATLQSSQFRVSPSIIITSGGDGLSLYARAGLVLPVITSTMQEIRSSEEVPMLGTMTAEWDTEIRDTEIKGAMSLGYQGAIGVSYGLSDNLSLFGELSGINLRVKAASSEMTKLTSEGVDVPLASLDRYYTHTNYVDELNSSSNNEYYNDDFDSSKAADELRFSSNFNALFINVGVKYSF